MSATKNIGSYAEDSLRGSSVRIGTTQRRLAWPLRKDDTHKSRSANEVNGSYAVSALGGVVLTCEAGRLYTESICLYITYYVCIYIYICCIHIYIYIYIYTYTRQRERERERERPTPLSRERDSLVFVRGPLFRGPLIICLCLLRRGRWRVCIM